MGLADELERVAAAVAPQARAGETLVAVLPTEPHVGARVYLCTFEGADSGRTWIAVDAACEAVSERVLVRDAVSILATCELAEESAGGGDLEELQQQLVALRITESPEGIDEAEAAVLALQRVIGAPPQLATPQRLDAIGLAARELELALGGGLQPSPFAEAMRAGRDVVDALLLEVEGAYRGELR
ncbi:MAG TPA: hypothetical protein VM204_04550 [Gaiellaceae bacterium]|nr:hypothetical protein [Gaiellaceae bacterium]